MSRELFRLRESLHNTPHLATQATFDLVDNYFAQRNVNMVDDEDDDDNDDEGGLDFSDDGSVAYISISGPLTYRPVQTTCGNGGSSYQMIYSNAVAAVEAGVKTIVLLIDSGGGQAYSCFTYATLVRQLATNNNINLITYVDGCACSAAYAWACIADEVIAHPQSTVGSVGVIVSLLDDSKAMEKEGYKRVFISAGENKHPFADDGSFSEQFIEKMQNSVNSLYEEFLDHVSNNLNIDRELIKNLGANTFQAKEAIQYGLVDKTMTQEELSLYVKKKKEDKEMFSFFKSGVQAENTQEEVLMVNQDVEAALAEFKAQAEAQKAEFEAALAEALASANQFKAQAEAAQAALAEFEGKAKAEKQKARMDALKAAVGDAEAADMFDVLASLDDAAFSKAVSKMQASVDNKQAVLSKEVGVPEKADLSKVAESIEMRMLKEKYAQ